MGQPFLVVSLISIHAPRVGSDDDYSHSANKTIISIHAPRVGSDFFRGFIYMADW